MNNRTFIFWLVLLSLAVIITIGIGNTGSEKRRAAEQEKFVQGMAKAAKQRIVYFEDERTGLCYAYIWGGDSHGGPALTLVPREKVEHLLLK